ncbi:MAG: GumC family protein [Leptolyngbyaceae bacterium]|nr:GumC family protein [Leptolyngbyaceae bacterium]
MSTESIGTREELDINAGQVTRLIQRRWLPALGVFLLTVAASALVASLQKETYEATAKMLFRLDRTASLTGVGEGLNELDPLVRAENPLVTEVEVISSRPIAEQVISELSLENNSGQPLSPSAIRQNLSVDIVGGADVVQVSYQGEDPEQVAAIANKVAEVYIERTASSSRAKASQARELVESQLPEAETFVQESEEALRIFKENNGVVAIDSDSDAVVANLQELDTQILATQAALVEATTRSNQLGENLGLSLDEALLMNDLSQSPAIQGVLQDLQEAERTLATQRGFYTDESPVVRTAQAEVEQLAALLSNELSALAGRADVPDRILQAGATRQDLTAQFLEAEVERLSLASRLEALNTSRGSYQSRSNALPRLEQQESELRRRLEVARLNYQTLLQRLQELKLAENQSAENVQLIEPALVPNRAQTNTLTFILAGVLIGALLAATLVFLLELNDSTVHQTQARKRSQLGV